VHKYAGIFSRGGPAFHGGVGRSVPGTLPVSTPPRAPVHPSGCTTCRPYRRLSRCCTYTACTFDCIPSRRGRAARPRCRQGERPHSGRSGSACTGPRARPASMFALRRSPGGSYRGPGGVLRAGGPLPPPPGRTVQGVTVRRLCRAWGAQAVNAGHFAEPMHGRHTPPKRTPVLRALRSTMQGSSCTERTPAETSHPTALPRPECRASRRGQGATTPTRWRTAGGLPWCGRQVVAPHGEHLAAHLRAARRGRSCRSQSPLSAPLGSVVPTCPP